MQNLLFCYALCGNQSKIYNLLYAQNQARGWFGNLMAVLPYHLHPNILPLHAYVYELFYLYGVC